MTATANDNAIIEAMGFQRYGEGHYIRKVSRMWWLDLHLATNRLFRFIGSQPATDNTTQTYTFTTLDELKDIVSKIDQRWG